MFDQPMPESLNFLDSERGGRDPLDPPLDPPMSFTSSSNLLCDECMTLRNKISKSQKNYISIFKIAVMHYVTDQCTLQQ